MSAPLDSRQLKAFVTLAQTGSFTETARQLFLTHSAISHSMRALENDTGCRLLTKVGKKVMLTEAGEALLHYAERIVTEMDQARTSLGNLNKWGFRRLRLGVEASLCRQFLAPILAKLQEEFPRLILECESSETSHAATWLEAGEVDLLLGEEPLRNDRIEFIPLFKDSLVLVVRASHPWTARGHAPRDEVSNHPCILGGKTSLTRQMVEHYFSQEKIVLNRVIQVDGWETTKVFVKQGLGLGFLPWWVVRDDVAAGALAAFPLGRRHLTQTWGLSHRKDRPLDHVQTTLLKQCRLAAESFTKASGGQQDQELTDPESRATELNAVALV